MKLRGAKGSSYRVEPKPFAAGGQSRVHRGQDDDGQAVVVKVARPAASCGRSVEREGAILELLGPDGAGAVVPLLDRTRFLGQPALVLRRMEASANQVMAAAAERPDALERSLRFSIGVARCLGRLHRHPVGPIIHRDVKPANIMADAHGDPRLADLGGAVVRPDGAAREGEVFGSRGWAPLDQLLPLMTKPNPGWDTYAACSMAFWWLTGTRPELQADPQPLLTERGQACWRALGSLAHAQLGDKAARWRAQVEFEAARVGTTTGDILVPDAPQGLTPADREQVVGAVARLGGRTLRDQARLDRLARRLVAIFERGLSGRVEPGPRDRFADGDELADALQTALDELVVRHRPGLRWARWVAAAAGMFVAAGVVVTVPLAWAAISWVRGPGPTVPVSASVFPMGDTFGTGRSDERPVRQIPVGDFAIGRTEVSNRAYGACVEDGGCSPLAWTLKVRPTGVKSADFEGLDGRDQPVVGLTWSQAAAYCQWDGGRLPTEAEWELAATWSEGARCVDDKRAWPWGAEKLICERANFKGCVGTTAPVDSMPEGASAFGALQMTGNAWEWTATRYRAPGADPFAADQEARYVLRGGSYTSTADYLRPTFRRHSEASAVHPTHGVRCAYESGRKG